MQISELTKCNNDEFIITKKDNYLIGKQVKAFTIWLDSCLDVSGKFNHSYYLLKTKQNWQCSNLFEAFENYCWSYNVMCEVQGKQVSGSGFRETFDYLNLLAGSFRSAVKENDTELARKSALAMLTWGGVKNKNGQRILDMGEGVCDYFRQVQKSLNMQTCHLGNFENIFMNSGFTKLYFLLVDDFIMYDGRVGAALGLLGRMYAKEAGLEEVPPEIEFSYGSGKTSAERQKNGDRRNPSTEKYKLPSFNGKPDRQLNDNIKASWLIKELADKTESRFSLLPQGPLLNERMTAIQSAFFMIGYDVSTHRNSITKN